MCNFDPTRTTTRHVTRGAVMISNVLLLTFAISIALAATNTVAVRLADSRHTELLARAEAATRVGLKHAESRLRTLIDECTRGDSNWAALDQLDPNPLDGSDGASLMFQENDLGTERELTLEFDLYVDIQRHDSDELQATPNAAAGRTVHVYCRAYAPSRDAYLGGDDDAVTVESHRSIVTY